MSVPRKTGRYCTINGRRFKKSSFSPATLKSVFCVGVSVNGDKVFVVNTKTNSPVLKFTRDEWNAFVAGVKVGEFDIEVMTES